MLEPGQAIGRLVWVRTPCIHPKALHSQSSVVPPTHCSRDLGNIFSSFAEGLLSTFGTVSIRPGRAKTEVLSYQLSKQHEKLNFRQILASILVQRPAAGSRRRGELPEVSQCLAIGAGHRCKCDHGPSVVSEGRRDTSNLCQMGQLVQASYRLPGLSARHQLSRISNTNLR